NPTDTTQKLNKKATPPEFGWWEFNIDDVTAGKGAAMSAITDAKDPDLSRFLVRKGGKLLLYHGWADPEGPAQPTVDYYKRVLETTFGGDEHAAPQKVRLSTPPCRGHCGKGRGPNGGPRLARFADWRERGAAPDDTGARHFTNGRQDNERKVCAYPQRAVYAGPPGGENNPANWMAQNFACR